MDKFLTSFSYFTVLLAIVVSACCVSCSNDDDDISSNDISMNIQQYKWVCHTSDEPLIDDDYQWAIFDDYVITLYFMNDNECVIRYYRKNFDTDFGTSYERKSQTVQYVIQDKKIFLDNSNYTGKEFLYAGEFLSNNNFIYEREEITYSDREWLEDNFNHIEPDPDESASKAFMGLNEIYADTWSGVAFGNPQCDESGRLIYYKAMFNRNMRYEYSGNTIISKSSSSNSYEQNTYTLTNGLITSFVRRAFNYDELKFTEYYTIKYDNNKRIIQIISDDGKNTDHSKTYYNFKWNSSGDLYESDYVNFRENNEPSYIYTYEYLSSAAQTPCMILGGNELWCAYNLNIDPILVMEGYYGNSAPEHNLKSKYAVMVFNQKPYERYNWSYSIDSKGRMTKITQKFEDLYGNGKNDETEIFTVKWQ